MNFPGATRNYKVSQRITRYTSRHKNFTKKNKKKKKRRRNTIFLPHLSKRTGGGFQVPRPRSRKRPLDKRSYDLLRGESNETARVFFFQQVY